MSIKYDFSDKHFLITGATSGIGQKNALDLNNAKASLTLVGRNKVRLASNENEFHKAYASKVIAGDLTENEFIETLSTITDPLDGLVLSAGIVDYTPSKMISKEKIRRVFDINFDADVLLIQALLKKKKINNNSSIVIISSISAKLGVPGTALYAASKAAISAYARVLASELSNRRIRVNTIFPGVVKTNLISNEGVVSDTHFNEAEREYPLGYGSAQDISNQIMYLLSEASGWVTGSQFIVDGGYTLK